MLLTRRKLLSGAALLFAAPAVVSASSLMPVKRRMITWEYRGEIVDYNFIVTNPDTIVWIETPGGRKAIRWKDL